MRMKKQIRNILFVIAFCILVALMTISAFAEGNGTVSIKNTEFDPAPGQQFTTTLYIDDICVDEKARGKHIGKALFEYVKAFAKEKGCYNITLHVWECNPGAVAFYKALGMKPQFTSMEMVL